jgi:integrase
MTSSKAAPTPKYRRQKRPNGDHHAFVELNGQRHYLGHYNSRESRCEYHRLIAEWEASGRQTLVQPDEITIVELCARYWRHAVRYYGTKSAQLWHYRMAMRRMKALYADQPAAVFGPRALKAIREQMVRDGKARTYINDQAMAIRRIFRWAVSEQIVSPTVLHALQAVDGLRCGRTEARETRRVKPVPEACIDAVRPFVSRRIEAMIDVQLLTACRPGEVVVMRPVDLETSGKVWLYRPADHKNQWRGHDRIIYIGPRCQRVIEPFFVGRAVSAFLFSPREAESERHADAPTHRRANQADTPRKTQRTLRDHYTRRPPTGGRSSTPATMPVSRSGHPAACATAAARTSARSTASKPPRSCSATPAPT